MGWSRDGSADVVAECRVPYEVMYAIGSAERSLQRQVGYPYLIAANGGGTTRCATRLAGPLFIDRRTIDCGEREACSALAEALVSECGENFDLGAFQLNYRWHRFAFDEYFELAKSYRRACGFVEELAARHGWSWDTVAMYHSSTPKHKEPYRKKIVQIYQKEVR